VADNTIGKYTRGKLLKLIDQRADGLVAGGEANQNAFPMSLSQGQPYLLALRQIPLQSQRAII